MTDDDAFAEQLRIMRNHGGRDRYFYDRVGGNFRLDALQAAILSVKLPHLRRWEEARRANAAFYDQALSGLAGVVTPRVMPNAYHVYNQYVLRIKDGRRSEFEDRLKRAQVAYAIYYPLCLHQQGCFAYLGYPEGAFPVSEQAAKEVLAIPVLTDQAEYVAAALKGEV